MNCQDHIDGSLQHREQWQELMSFVSWRLEGRLKAKGKIQEKDATQVSQKMQLASLNYCYHFLTVPDLLSLSNQVPHPAVQSLLKRDVVFPLVLQVSR